ncbi:histidine kinase dimerization/phospho-acceptor domain-containing protein [Benzoatithermus flavus]|uniref:histidine kinase n=1 Tax=Benzoatithermus flavus TaxID=3108223 RepID=A0ABU8XXE7_9PROT
MIGLGRTAAGGLHYEQIEHELRTPLASIRSAAEILRDYPDLDEAERRCFVQLLVVESERLGNAVELLLGHSGLQRALQHRELRSDGTVSSGRGRLPASGKAAACSA